MQPPVPNANLHSLNQERGDPEGSLPFRLGFDSAEDTRERIVQLGRDIEASYETGRLEDIEDREQELEAMLESMENQQLEMEAEAQSDDDAWPDAESELARMKLQWDEGAIHPEDGQTFAQFVRSAFAGEGPYDIQPGVTDEQIQAAAEDAAARRRRIWSRGKNSRNLIQAS